MNVDFENILLKKLLYNGEFYGKVMPILKGHYFSNIGNKELFVLTKQHYEKYRDIPTLTELVAKVKDVPNAEIRAEVVKSLQTVDKVDEIANLEFMCEETVSWVRDSMYLEALQLGSDGLMNKDDNLKLKAQEILDQRAKVSIDTDLGLSIDDIEEMIEYYSERQVGIRSQHKELNKRLGPGFLPKTLSLIMAASGVGKSLLMTDLISGMIKQGKNILLVSLEMADKEIMKRVHANAMDLPINSLIDLSKTEGELNELDRPALTKEMVRDAYTKLKMTGTCGKFYVKDYPAGSFSPLMLENLVESYRVEKGIEFDIVFVDYMGIMKSDRLSPSVGLYSYIKSIAEELRAVASKLELPIVSASQLNRSATGETDADNSAVSDSLGSVMTADFIMFLLQNEEMKERGEIVAKTTKNRFTGRTDTWLMGIQYEYMKFYDLVTQGQGGELEITPQQSDAPKIDDDFGIVTSQKQADAEEYATNEIKEIIRKDHENASKSNPFVDDLDKIYEELGL